MSEPSEEAEVVDPHRRPAHAAADGSPSQEVALPEEISEEIEAQVEARVDQIVMERYASPFPHPDHLERYEQLFPGAARVIFSAYEAQSAHRREMERQFADGNEARANRGQWLAFSLVAAALGLGLVCILNGEAGVGGAIVTVAFGGGVVLYIAGAGSRGRAPARQTRPTSRDRASATRGTAVAKRPANGE